MPLESVHIFLVTIKSRLESACKNYGLFTLRDTETDKECVVVELFEGVHPTQTCLVVGQCECTMREGFIASMFHLIMGLLYTGPALSLDQNISIHVGFFW